MSLKPIWEPSQNLINQSNLSAFIKLVNDKYQPGIKSYEQLYDWSVEKIDQFWAALWEFTLPVHSVSYEKVLVGDDIREASWFEGARFNFAENLLRYRDERTALIYQSEDQAAVRLTYSELYRQVKRCAAALKKLGVKKNDRVSAFITNRPEAIIAMLATASIGAVWSSCSPDFGFQGVLDRFGQIKPKVLIAVNEYKYNGKEYDSLETLKQIDKTIPEIEKIVVIDCLGGKDKISLSNWESWDEFLIDDDSELEFEQLPFDHPLYIMYSSGTTGKPKCIVHGAGGTLLQHLKELVLHTDLKREDVITYFTTCGWMMWNWLVSSLAVGATVYLYDGSPSYPGLGVLFESVEKEKITIFGTSPKFLSACELSGLIPKNKYDLSSLNSILSTGAPLSTSNFEYVYKSIKNNLRLSSISGGTDIISCFMLGNPILPVYSGELQCRGLGMKVETYDENGQSVIGEVGELVCTAPFPSRPIYFWNDEDGSKYKSAYFEQYENIWRHGDFIKINQRGGVIVFGRSDATLNPGGVRIGTAEIYGVVESMDEIVETLVIGKKTEDDTIVVLFIVTADGIKLDDQLKQRIKSTIKAARTPRHVPSEIYQVKDIPRTLNGKKVELAVTNLIHGRPVTNKDSLVNPESLQQFEKFIIKS